MRTVEALEKLASAIPPMAYDIANYKTLGLLEELIDVADPVHPTAVEVENARNAVLRAIESTRAGGVTLSNRLGFAQPRQYIACARTDARTVAGMTP